VKAYRAWTFCLLDGLELAVVYSCRLEPTTVVASELYSSIGVCRCDSLIFDSFLVRSSVRFPQLTWQVPGRERYYYSTS
jgi:hypothetical protein